MSGSLGRTTLPRMTARRKNSGSSCALAVRRPAWQEWSGESPTEMRWWPTTSQGLLRLAAATTSIVGFTSAIWIYLATGPAPESRLGYEPEDSKRYLRDLERYGGKANVVAGEITEWFNGLWHGRRLAFIVACVTVIVAGALLLAAIPMDSDLGDEGSNRTRRGEGDSP